MTTERPHRIGIDATPPPEKLGDVAAPLNAALEDADHLFQDRFCSAAEVNLPSGGKLYFTKQLGGKFQLAIESHSYSIEVKPLKNATLLERTEAARLLDALWFECEEAEGRTVGTIKEATSHVRDFLARRRK